MDTIPAIEARLVASIHQQVATFFKRTTPVERAMDLCRKLDAIKDDDAQDILILIGKALGGENAKGFVATLTAQLDDIEDDAAEDEYCREFLRDPDMVAFAAAMRAAA